MYKLLKSGFFEESYIDWTNVLGKAAQTELQPPHGMIYLHIFLVLRQFNVF